MRMVRIAQVAIGLATSSGMAVVLSGSALAADSGSSTTPQQSTSLSAPALTGVVTNPVAPVVTKVTAGTSKDVQSETSKSVSTPGSTGGAAPTDSAGANTVGVKTESLPVIQKPVVERPAASDKSDSNESRAAALVRPAQSAVTPPSQDHRDVVTISTPVTETPALGGTVVYHSTVLPIMSKITNHVPPAVADLAADLPSAPTHGKDPVPTQSSGLLGHLTAQLAGSVVPQLLTGYTDPIRHLTLAVSLMVLILLLTNVFTFTYGLWLRRGGFATAARSDSSSLSPLSFATPSLLGYGSLPLRSHSPLFDGGRNESFQILGSVRNAFRKEEKL